MGQRKKPPWDTSAPDSWEARAEREQEGSRYNPTVQLLVVLGMLLALYLIAQALN